MSDAAVRMARFVDIPGILYLMQRCLDESRFADIAKLDQAEAEANLISLIGSNEDKPRRKAIVVYVTGELEHPTGMIAGTIQPLYGGLTLDVGTEMLWYVDKERAEPTDGMDLWETLQAWFDQYPKPLVRQQTLTAAVIDHKILARGLRRQGFLPIGTVLEKGKPK